MFEQSMLTEAPVNRGPILTAMMLQSMGVAVLLVAPLIWIEQLPAIPPLPPEVFAPRTLKPMKVFTEGFVRSAAAPKLTQPRAFTAPPRVPSKIVVDRELLRDEGITIAQTGRFDSTGTLPFQGPDLGGLPDAPPMQKPKPAPEVRKPDAPKSVRISSMDPSKLIHQVKPVYPELASRARVTGTVKLQAVIAADGTIQKLQVISGHPLLIAAAVTAVQQWRYSPTMLGGQPVEVITQVDVNFVLGR